MASTTDDGARAGGVARPGPRREAGASDRPPAVPGADAETESVARDLAAAYATMAAFYRDQMGLAPAAAEARARGAEPEADLARDRRRALEAPPDQVAWGALSRLAERDPDAMNAAWTRIKEAAWAELKSGHRAARALERGGRPWDRARFLAVREAFRADWCPRGGIEDALIDTLAQSYATYLEWTARLHARAAADGATEDAELKREGTWRPPRLTTAQATEQSAAMAERAHRMFLRTLRALQDLRRSPSVAIAAAGQVNIGAQQVNVAAPAEGDPAEGTPARRTP